jgi:hypothetical protein
MVDKNNLDIVDPEIMEDVMNDLLKIFGKNSNYLTKSECREILNIVFEALFDEKLKTKNFNYIFKLISKDDEKKINKSDLEPVIRSFIVCFDVNYITNCSLFTDKVCIKIGKHLLPVTYYIKKNGES